jgi:hypothetical protein
VRITSDSGSDTSDPNTSESDTSDSGVPAVSSEKGEVSFSIIDVPASVDVNRSFTIRMRALNPTGDYLQFDAWSYIYKGSRCVSGEREQNRKSINLPAFSDVTFDLENTAYSAGNFTLKISLLRSDRKTPVEFKRSLFVVGLSTSDDPGDGKDSDTMSEDIDNKTSASQSKKNITLSPLSVSPLSITGDAVYNLESGDVAYRSSSAKGKDIVLYIILFALAAIVIAVILKKL